MSTSPCPKLKNIASDIYGADKMTIHMSEEMSKLATKHVKTALAV